AFTTAHHLDIGALHPGSTGIVDAVDAYAEGLQFKAIKVYQRGQRNDAVWQILRDNIRAPQMVVGDMEAQIAACQHGVTRFIELVGQYGLNAVTAASEELMDYSERMLRAQIAKLPDGVYRAEGFIDGYIDSEKPEEKNLKIAVTLTVQGSDIAVDFTGTSPQVDLPINMPFIGTVDIAVYLVIRSILLDSALIEYVPQNDGLTRPITITAPKGTLTNPNFPAPTIARFCPGNIVADTVMRALSQVAPHNVSAGVGNLQVVAYSGPTADNYWVYMDITEGSYGGRDGKDGMDAVDTLFANTRNNPIEDIESHYPLRVTRYELREDAAGAGEFRGGLGSIREIQFLQPGRFGVEGDGHCFAPWGVFGGKEGSTGGLALINGNDERQLPSKIADRRSVTGDTLRTVSPCGGGYGDPLRRDPQRVLDDVADGYVSVESAREQYGVVITEGRIDEAATAQRRQAMRQQA
ncbi:hydantoinase B/oxoprolinase family protein, partial [Deinococcus sp.]|uniref:hydantoinase B/oxoprolinase family protein n=1 Tax=Deinococcus sp. TaxID=47478 RepID=UPI002869D909